MSLSIWLVGIGSERQLLDPRQKLEVSRKWELFVDPGQCDGAGEATIPGLINIQEDLHTFDRKAPGEIEP
jgi:hypothetical protein